MKHECTFSYVQGYYIIKYTNPKYVAYIWRLFRYLNIWWNNAFLYTYQGIYVYASLYLGLVSMNSKIWYCLPLLVEWITWQYMYVYPPSRTVHVCIPSVSDSTCMYTLRLGQYMYVYPPSRTVHVCIPSVSDSTCMYTLRLGQYMYV